MTSSTKSVDSSSIGRFRFQIEDPSEIDVLPKNFEEELIEIINDLNNFNYFELHISIIQKILPLVCQKNFEVYQSIVNKALKNLQNQIKPHFLPLLLWKSDYSKTNLHVNIENKNTINISVEYTPSQILNNYNQINSTINKLSLLYSSWENFTYSSNLLKPTDPLILQKALKLTD